MAMSSEWDKASARYSGLEEDAKHRANELYVSWWSSMDDKTRREISGSAHDAYMLNSFIDQVLGINQVVSLSDYADEYEDAMRAESLIAALK